MPTISDNRGPGESGDRSSGKHHSAGADSQARAPFESGPEGVLARLDVQTGPPVVVNALLDADSGGAIALYMRGRETRGLIRRGDRVRVDGEARRDADGTLLVSHLFNLTTTSPFAVWTPSLRSRVTDASGKALMSVVIGPAVGALVGALVAAVLSDSKTNASVSPHPGDSDTLPSTTTSSHLEAALIVGAIIALLVAVAIFYRLYVVPRRKERATLLAAARAP